MTCTAGVVLGLGLALLAPARLLTAQESQLLRVLSKDGTMIAVECAGSGPSLVIVHGGIGDRTRWTPMFPLLSSRFTVCAMDRRGHGASGDSPGYALQKEAEDVAAVVEARPGPVFLLGHSYGGVCALEAAFLTKRISKLLLYEPPLQERVDLALVGRIERMLGDGDRDRAVVTFLQEVVKVSPSEVAAMRSRPAWGSLVDSIGAHPRQMRALGAYRFDAARMSTLSVPTLLIRGSATAIPDVKRAFESLMTSLPNRTEVVLEGQHHNAMDSGRSQLAQVITDRLLGTAGASGPRAQVDDPHRGHALGAVDFPVSCARVQAEFNRAVALLHHMTYPQARKAFQQVAESDPRCAMAHWGIAMTLFQPLWPTRPTPEDLRQGWEEARKAIALEPPTERERLFVTALEAFFQDPTSVDYWARMRRFEDAMAKLHAAFPEDPEATAFFALAHLATAPAAGTSTSHSDLAAKLLLAIYEKNPEHPGAMHYLVHANDVPGRERESLEITRKYEKVAPRNPHALHMPTHIYTRLGDWEGVIRGNLRAAEAALEHPAGERGDLVWDEFPHAIEYLTYAQLQRGADEDAAAQVKRLQGTARLEPTFKTAFHLASIPARYSLERRAWSEAASIDPREPRTLDWDRFTWPEAVSWFARGFGAVRVRGVEEARRAQARLEVLETNAEKAGEELFARQIRILRLELEAWLALAEGDGESGISLSRQAAELEASTPKPAVTPAPTLPAHELLGDLLMEQKLFREAVRAYERSLELHPRRFNSLLGAARAARAAGDESSALRFYRDLVAVAAPGSSRTGLQEARRLVSEAPPREERTWPEAPASRTLARR